MGQIHRSGARQALRGGFITMKILVTGGGGFLGRYIVRLSRERGDTVSILGRSEQPDLAAQGVEVIRGDIADSVVVMNACRNCDAVIHVAANAGVWGGWESFFQPNVVGTRNVIAACRKHHIQRLVYTSTPSVVYTGEPIAGADESLPYGRNWLCHYPHTKAIAEKELLEANDPGRLRTIALRPHLIWGVGDPHLIPRVVARARSGRLRIVGEGTNRVDITHVENAARAHLLALDALDSDEHAGKAYFISQGEAVFLWKWINELLGKLSEPTIKKSISLPVAYALGALFEGVYRTFRVEREPPMTRFVAIELAKDHYFDIAAARNDLGYSPIRSTSEGVDQLVEHLKRT